MKNKRGISPLIGTVLIIGFTVALAVVIMNWGTLFTKGIQQRTEETSGAQLDCVNQVDFDITCTCSGSPTSSCAYDIINNQASTLLTTRVRAFGEDGNLVGTEAGPLNIGGYLSSATTSPIVISPAQRNVELEIIAETVQLVNGNQISCGNVAIVRKNCFVQ